MNTGHGFNPADYFRPNGDGYDMTAPALIWMAATSINDLECGAAGRQRARRAVEETMVLIRRARYPKFDWLETLLLNGNGKPRVVLPMLKEAIDLVGDGEVIALIQRLMDEGNEA